MPMTKDKAVLEANHQKAADDVETYLKQGKNVVFLTLGDPTVYSTYLYVHKRILDRGYEAEIVSSLYPAGCSLMFLGDSGVKNFRNRIEHLHVFH